MVPMALNVNAFIRLLDRVIDVMVSLTGPWAY